MKSLNSTLLSEMIKSKRGNRGLREVAKEIGNLSAPTLSRIENGNLPDIDTYFKICKWLDVPTDYFTASSKKGKTSSAPAKKEVIAHLRADKTLPQSTAEALIKMINLAYAELEK
jgi:transcriptional regulator with XRE-family HTH domain